MKICLVGLPNSGKTTLFNALTNSQAAVTSYSSKVEPNMAVIDVLDARITHLSSVYKPKKTIYASVEIIDMAGVQKKDRDEEAFSPDLMKLIKNSQAMALVIRNFHNEIDEPPDPLEDIKKIDEELLLSDLLLAEKRLEKIRQGFSRGIKTPALHAEEKILQKVYEQLNVMQPIRNLTLTDEEEKIIRGFQFFTKKPLLVILNSNESSFSHHPELLQKIGAIHPVIEFAGKFEMELAALDEDEVQAFMEDMGISQSAKDRLSTKLYDILGYISFFTVGDDEVRAWNIHRGDNALDAAGTIHSDLARGFIRAECFTFNDIAQYGSEKKIKEMGKFRLEGKNYQVQDGDILSIRFNV